MDPIVVAFLHTQPAWMLGAAFAIAVLFLVVKYVRKAIPVLRGFARLVDGFLGIEAKGDQPRVPGVLELLRQHGETLTAHGELLAKHTADLGVVKHEVQHNSGGSIKDAVKRLEESVVVLKEGDAAQDQRIGQVLAAVASVGGAVGLMQTSLLTSGAMSTSPQPTTSSGSSVSAPDGAFGA